MRNDFLPLETRSSFLCLPTNDKNGPHALWYFLGIKIADSWRILERVVVESEVALVADADEIA